MQVAVLDSLQEELRIVEEFMRAALATDEPRVAALIDDLGEFHGKMLRPAMLMLVARALGEVDDTHRRLAASIELIHTATLIHDDIIDDGDTRRGQPSAHKRFGNSVAVLLGDYFYTHAFDLAAQIGQPAVLARLTAITNTVCRGELHQMCARRDTSLTEDEYFRIIYAKTAALCEVSCAFGALAGTPELQDAAGAYGRCCGLAFQIVDDCLDVVGDAQKIGKTLATDIENGRLTLPFIRLLELSPASERSQLATRLLDVRSTETITALCTLVRERGAIDAAMSTARAYADEACGHALRFPAGPIRQQLLDLASFIIAREF